MFKRAVLKQRAKETLSGNYWKVMLIILISNGITSSVMTITSLMTSFGEILPSNPLALVAFGMLQFASIAISIAASAFVTLPVKVGVNKYMLETCEKKTSNILNIFYAFRTNYMGIVAVSFAKSLIINLLLFVPIIVLVIIFGTAFSFQSDVLLFALLPLFYVAMIPTLIKTYDYYLVEYILTEKPELSWKEALAESKALMRGNRFKVFVLNLSFIGWIMLGILALFVGVIFVMPYIQATDAELYRELSGKTTIQDNVEGV